MKKLTYLAVPLLLTTLLLGGCAPSTSTESGQQPLPTTPATEPVKALKREEALGLLARAVALDQTFYVKSTHTTEEVYAHFDSLYTRSYIDSIILGGGNLKKDGQYWVLAHPGGEFIEGTFLNEVVPDQLKIETLKDGKTLVLTHSVGDGLYAPHEEIITLIHEDHTWKIDHLEWRPLQ